MDIDYFFIMYSSAIILKDAPFQGGCFSNVINLTLISFIYAVYRDRQGLGNVEFDIFAYDFKPFERSGCLTNKYFVRKTFSNLA